jgi:hypothetical protein
MKTNAVRLLEQMEVVHELRAYEVDLDDLTVCGRLPQPPAASDKPAEGASPS